MMIDAFVLGDFQTNSYCVRVSDSAKDCLLIDTGLDSEPLLEFLCRQGLNPVAVIFTHGHADHIAGLPLLREKFPNIKSVIHRDDAKMLSNPVKNLSIVAGKFLKVAPADILIEKDGPIEFAGLSFEVLHTPGHTAGGICLYNRQEKVVFAGDTLFAGSIGRTDFPGGSFEQLIAGIKEKLLRLDDDTKVYCGHGPGTTIGTERKFNQYLAD